MDIAKHRNTVLLIACLMLAGCATAGSSPEPTTPPPVGEASLRAIEQGQAALSRQDFEGASTLFQQALREDPENAQARLGLAESYLGLGTPDVALRLFRELGEDDEVAIEALQGKGIILLLKGQHQEAYDALSAAVREQPRMWRAWNALGRYHDGQRNWTEAEKAYQNALTWAPARAAAALHNNWGMSAMAQGRYADAVLHFSTAIEQDRDLKVAKANLRLALAFQGRYVEAMSGVTHSERAAALNNLGFVAMLRGDHARAEAYFLRALESSPRFHDTASKNLQLLANLKEVNTTKAQAQMEEAGVP